jgi:polyphenol oxidase
MIVPHQGTVFTGAAEGDLRGDLPARAELARRLGIGSDWAVCRQVHGARVHRAQTPGDHGEGDALWTDLSGLPLAVFTADCLGVVLIADHAVGVAHAGWRGARAEVVGALAAEMAGAGHPARRAFIGPAIGPCCFEVGADVAELFPDATAQTSWGTLSVDLARVVTGQLEGLEIEMVGGCTRHEEEWFSHRRDGTTARQAAVVWKQ